MACHKRTARTQTLGRMWDLCVVERTACNALLAAMCSASAAQQMLYQYQCQGVAPSNKTLDAMSSEAL